MEREVNEIMKAIELINKLAKLNCDLVEIEIVVEELIGGFQEDIENVIVTKDKFTHKPIIAITFRNQ